MIRATHHTGLDRFLPSRFLRVMALAVIALLLTVATAFGEKVRMSHSASEVESGASAEDARDTSTEREGAVTTAIELEEGGAIDLEMANGDVIIDTWDGDEVIVIIEKLSKKGSVGGGKSTARPVDVRVTRLGKNVRIAALDAEGRQLTDDLSFRIMMPRSTDRRTKKVGQGYDLSRLTSVVFRALHREALNWIMR